MHPLTKFRLKHMYSQTSVCTDDAGTLIDVGRMQAVSLLRWKTSTPEGRDVKMVYKSIAGRTDLFVYAGMLIFLVVFSSIMLSMPDVIGKLIGATFVVFILSSGSVIIYIGTIMAESEGSCKMNPDWYTLWRMHMLRLNRCPACAYSLPDPPPLPENLPFPPAITPLIPPPSTDHLTRCTECGHQWYLPLQSPSIPASNPSLSTTN